ncbi:hypothetical protein [Massilia aerilata]|uniref:Uncharacterized protein n=1 Tax=Massilia aerilata TaxID=453817 RepID=A0ABW0RTP0_9BURK
MRGGFVTVRLTSRWPYNPLSLAIGIAAGSRQFSHAIAIIGDRAYEASMTHGCRAGTIEELMEGVAIYRDMPVWVPDVDAARAFAEAQVGKGYDWPGAVGIPFTYSEDWSDDSCWWCSDLAFAIVLAGGVRLFDPGVMKRARPIDLHMADYRKGPIQRWLQPPAPPGAALPGAV